MRLACCEATLGLARYRQQLRLLCHQPRRYGASCDRTLQTLPRRPARAAQSITPWPFMLVSSAP
jgi:hypothetical protein